MSDTFRVALTRDILDSRGEPAFGRAALSILERAPNLAWEYLPQVVREIDADHAAAYDAIYVNIARVPAAAVARHDCRLRVIARHGVGYDTVDVPAMTRAGVLVTNTPTSMPRPVATVTLTFILALAGKLFLKDKLTRSGRWHERMDNMGLGLTGRTLGVIGAGRIGQEIMRMARTFDLKLLAACVVSGKTPAFLATDDAWARDYAAKGFRLMAYGIDQSLYQEALRHGLDVLRGAVR